MSVYWEAGHVFPLLEVELPAGILLSRNVVGPWA